MILLSNDQIKKRVDLIIEAFLKDTTVKPKDERVIKAAAELATNLLQNINTIAQNAAASSPG
jgi:hypothetical protein